MKAKAKKMSEQTMAQAKPKDIDVVRTEGNKIILPEGMSLDDGIQWLVRKKENEEKIVIVDETIDCFPLEGAYAFFKVLSEKFGFTTLADTPGFFGPKPPSMVGVLVAPNVTEQVPWGRIQVPGLEDGYLAPSCNLHDGRLVFSITGACKRKYLPIVAELAAKTREYIRTRSIYRGKAIRASFPVSDDPNDFNVTDCPRFMDLGDIKSTDLIFPEATKVDVETNILTLIRHTKACREAGIPRKRGVLLEGPYGVGKTLTANVTAKACTENGWTFIYLNDVSELPNAIHFAKQYQPACIFAEDIDSVTEDEDGEDDRDETMTSILNTIDGIDTKTLDVMVVLTTNHVERINKAFLRPGRLDAVVSIRPPDAKAVEALIRLYGRGLVPEDAHLGSVAEKLNGQIPAVVREVVERSKLAAIRARGEAKCIEPGDLHVAADSMLAHLKLLAEETEPEANPVEAFTGMLAEHLVERMKTNGLAIAEA